MNTINYSSNGLGQLNADPRFSGLKGKGSVVVIDTGFNLNHIGFDPDYNGDGISDTFIRKDLDFTFSGNRDVRDGNQHGLTTTSIIANMAKDASIVPIQINTVGQMANAVTWSVANKDRYGINTISISLSDIKNTMGSTPDAALKPLYTAIGLAEKAGITVVASAGNYYQAYGGVQGGSGIAGLNNVIGVSAVKSNGITDGDMLWEKSQRRPDFLAAPGNGVPVYSGGNTTNGYTSGTSLSAPFLAGTIPILQQVSERYLGRNLRPSEVDSLLSQTSTALPNSPGSKQINVYNAADLIYKVATGQAPNTIDGTPHTIDSLTTSTAPTNWNQSYYGGSNFNVLVGRSTTANNFVDGGGVGSDLLVGGTGVNTFNYRFISQGNDDILNFTPGRDKINISGVMRQIGYTGLNPISDKKLTIGTSGNNTVIGIDLDGGLPGLSQPLATLVNVNPSAMLNMNNFVI